MPEVVRTHRVVETHVMGRAAVLNLAAWMVPAALVQGFTQDASRLIESFGGMTLSITWATCLLLGAAFVVTARFITNPRAGVVLEVPGTLLLALAIAAYAVAVLLEQGLIGSVFVICLCGSSVLNLAGRTRMLLDRSGVARKATKDTG